MEFQMRSSVQTVQNQDPVRAPGPVTQKRIACKSTCLRVEVVSGAQRNPESDLGSTSIFFGSDFECDFILSEDYFPPIYAVLLVDSQGAVLRYLGGGPPLLLDHIPVTRQRFTKSAIIAGGPLALKIHFSPEVSAMEYPQCSDVRPQASTTEYDLSRDGEVRVEKNIQLIEQASRLLANISDQKMNASTQTTVTRDRVNSNPWHHSSAELSLSVGRPATGQLPPLWHHIYVN